jgi:hypothetical protein
MNTQQIIAIALIIIGVAGLVYGGFTYVKSTHTTNIGPIEVSVKDKETINIPVWTGVAAVLTGGIFLFAGSWKRSKQ